MANSASRTSKLTVIPLHETISVATPLQVRHTIEKAKAAASQIPTSTGNATASTSPSAVNDSVLATTRAEDVPVATTMEAVQDQVRSERLERQREMRKMRVEKERVARVEKYKRDLEAPIIRKDRWGRKSQEQMTKRKQRRALEQELERLEAERETRRQERRERRRSEEQDDTLVE